MYSLWKTYLRLGFTRKLPEGHFSKTCSIGIRTRCVSIFILGGLGCGLAETYLYVETESGIDYSCNRLMQ